nr:amidohydrolase family protein [Kibdelosporangium sp. MJ126-NF4]CEL19954.1 2-amino-3-carboxymuconate-6-semialdehyde decarboxylase [Kibdelosporangium sp. MJ126-NF4]CTQ97178.1 2-amino-3-carboxymuconate-6-semialdehyde decarboxylase (EC 4.1.1.45) [Kibdelosporangium sp. MJ126-NF4]
MLIDVHGHLGPLGEKPGDGPPGLHDPDGMIERKARAGITMTIIGTPVGAGDMRPLPGLDNFTQTADQVKAHNELMGELVSAYPEHLRSYVYLDPFGGEAMLAQAAELLAEWQYVGVVANTSINGEYLDSPKAADFFAAAAEWDKPVLLHPPAVPVGADSLAQLGFGVVEHVGRYCDVTAGLAAILSAKWLEQYPSLRLIAAAGGGALALLLEKIDMAARRQRGRQPGDPLPSSKIGSIYVETSNPSRHQLAANVAALGADKVLFGTDAPPVLDNIETATGAVRSADFLTEEQRELIHWRNAAELFELAAVPVS